MFDRILNEGEDSSDKDKSTQRFDEVLLGTAKIDLEDVVNGESLIDKPEGRREWFRTKSKSRASNFKLKQESETQKMVSIRLLDWS